MVETSAAGEPAETRATSDQKDERGTRRPPGPNGWPLLGNTVQFVRDPFAFYDRLASYGDVVSYSVAGQPFCTVLRPEHVRRVLVTDAEKYGKWSAEEFGADFASEGVLMTEGEQWRRQRKALQPAFTLARVRAYGDSMVTFAADLVGGWTEGERVALDREFSGLTLRILAKSLFDIDSTERGHVVREAAAALNDRADARTLSAFLPGWVPTPANRRYRTRMSRFEAFVNDRIDERRVERRTDRNADPHREDLLSLLLDVTDENSGIDDDSAGATMSEREVRDQLITFLFAGHETTSLALTYTFLSLARHPEKRAVLRTELDSVLGGDTPSVTDLPELTYTEKVIKEALRLYPPAYVIFREVRENVELGGYEIAAGTRLTLPQFRLHTDERFFEAPQEFRPERWTSEFEAELPDYAYFPFGGGPRHCIGMRFAMLELRLVLTTIAQEADLELVSDPDPDLRMSATLRPEDPIEARVRER